MKNLNFLFLVLILLTSSCSEDIESYDIFGKYECIKTKDYYEYFTPLHEKTVEEIILIVEPLNSDSMIIDGVTVFRDKTFKWRAAPYDVGMRAYEYRFEEDSIFVDYNFGGFGGGVFVEIKGRRIR